MKGVSVGRSQQKNRRVDQEGEVNAPNVCCLVKKIPKQSPIGKEKMKIIFKKIQRVHLTDFFQVDKVVFGVNGQQKGPFNSRTGYERAQP